MDPRPRGSNDRDGHLRGRQRGVAVVGRRVGGGLAQPRMPPQGPTAARTEVRRQRCPLVSRVLAGQQRQGTAPQAFPLSETKVVGIKEI